MEFGITLMARNSNPDAVQWITAMYNGEAYRPKPVTVKGKSIKRAAYKNFPDQNYLEAYPRSEWINGAKGANVRFIGPGKAIIDDKASDVLDTNCADQAGLASFDPRTVRGRGVVDPPRDFDKVNDECGHANFEEKYATSLQSKLLDNGNYVFPIPYFANKYQHYFRFVNIRGLDENGWVTSSIATNKKTKQEKEIIHTDQRARQIRVRLLHGESPMEFYLNDKRQSGELPEFGYGGRLNWSAEELDRMVNSMHTDGDLEAKEIQDSGVPRSHRRWKHRELQILMGTGHRIVAT